MLGIDVSKDRLSVCQWDGSRGCAAGAWEMPNSEAGVRELLATTSAEEPLAVEPTGRYSELVVREAQAQGRQVLLAPPRAAKQFLASVAPRAKTDRLDAQGLAQYAASVPLRPFVLKEARMEEVSQLLNARKLLALSLAALRQQAGALVEARAALGAVIQTAAAQIKELDRRIGRLGKQEPAVRQLQAVPGIGPLAAAALAVRLKTTPFAGYDQFVAYVGLDLRVVDSGKHRGRRRVSHQGDAELRRLLYLCAQASVRTKGSPFAQQYERERAKGLASTQALCAVARKLAKVAWALVRTGAPYDPARVYQKPHRA